MAGYAHRRFVIAMAALALVAWFAASAQESKSKSETIKAPKNGPKEKIDFHLTDTGQASLCAISVTGAIAAGDYFAALGTRVLATDARAGFAERVPGWKFVFTEPVPIHASYLDAIQDGLPVPVTQVEKGKAKPEFWSKPDAPEWSWLRALADGLRRSDDADLEMFKKAAERSASVSYPQLRKTPERYRGKIITVSGKLTKVKKEPAPPFVPESIEHYYTGWIVDSSLGAPPIAVAFTELPDKVEPGQELSLRVTFRGFFLSLIQRPADAKDGPKKDALVTPFLVGRTPVVSAADEPFPLDPRYLEPIQDRRPLPVIDIDKSKPIPEFWDKPGGSDWGWYMAFNDALRRSDEADLAMFKRAAVEHSNLVYADLKNTPAQHRGKIVTVTGKLAVIRKSPAPRFVQARPIYTGYIIGPTKGAPPFTVAFTELPEELKGPDKEKKFEHLNLEVTFHGYFLSLVHFPPDKKDGTKQEGIDSPYLVGKTLTINKGDAGADEEKSPYTYYVLLVTVGGILAIAILVAGLNMWFRRGDREIQAKLSALRDKNQPFDLEADDAPPQTGIKPDEPSPGDQPPISP